MGLFSLPVSLLIPSYEIKKKNLSDAVQNSWVRFTCWNDSIFLRYRRTSHIQKYSLMLQTKRTPSLFALCIGKTFYEFNEHTNRWFLFYFSQQEAKFSRGQHSVYLFFIVETGINLKSLPLFQKRILLHEILTIFYHSFVVCLNDKPLIIDDFFLVPDELFQVLQFGQETLG